jgi:hypothetical protein
LILACRNFFIAGDFLLKIELKFQHPLQAPLAGVLLAQLE